ncbi:unnamed protein product [Prorocentrum cordatum]|uniref:Phospholipase B-like n=1 Tax=Prorocentrum cordatum TaxID=2364126 RepID=A0ABN9QXX8_9DINO|nr:unnamed protein product [Polarella glacialis]
MAAPAFMQRTLTVYDYINESTPETSPYLETLMHIEKQHNYAMYMSRSNSNEWHVTDWHGNVSYWPNNMMVVQFNCLGGASKDVGGPKLTDAVLKTTVPFKTNGGEWRGHDYRGRSIRMVPKEKYRWEAQSWVQSHAWDDQAGWRDVENPWDDGRGRALQMR